jgi:putative sterol carrier protein
MTKYIFGSKEWLEHFAKLLNEDENYRKAAKDWEDPITLIVTNLPPRVKEYFKKEQIIVWFDLWHGECRAVEILNDPNERKSGITLTGSYSTIKKIALGNLSPTVAIMTGQLKAKGNVMKLITNAGASAAFVNVIKKVPTEFLE